MNETKYFTGMNVLGCRALQTMLAMTVAVIFIFNSHATASSGDSVIANNEVVRPPEDAHFELSLSGGFSHFLGDVGKEIKTSPYIAGKFGYELSKWTSGYLQGGYSFLKLKNNKDFHGLHQFLGRAGLETSDELFKFASLGAGVSLAFVRGDSATPAASSYMLSDNESEFGFNVCLNINALRINKFILGAQFFYDKIWTIPNSASFVSGGLFAGFRI